MTKELPPIGRASDVADGIEAGFAKHNWHNNQALLFDQAAEAERQMVTRARIEARQAAIDTLASEGYPNDEVLRTCLDIHNMPNPRDPLYTDEDKEEIVNRFRQLQAGQYVVGLENNHGSRFTGIVAAEPTLTVEPGHVGGYLVPYPTWAVPLIEIQDGEPNDAEVVMSVRSLSSGTIGKEAIQAMMLTHIIGTSEQLKRLRQQIDTLYTLGMEKIDTRSLDAFLENTKSKNHPNTTNRGRKHGHQDEVVIVPLKT